MIEACRVAQAAHQNTFAEGLTEWVSGEVSPSAVAASQYVAETFQMWRKVLDTKFSQD